MSQVMITLQQIKNADPCEGGWKKVKKANGGTKADMSKAFPLSSILDSNDLEDTLWALQCLPEYHWLWRKFAVWCARQVQHLMTDHRSIDALDVAWRHSDGLATDEELAAARDAAWDAAWDAARDAARDAAWAAAWDAARDAAWDAARDAARDAAWDAARDAARDAQSKKLRQILDAGTWVDDAEVEAA
jgi:hypothetical protein